MKKILKKNILIIGSGSEIAQNFIKNYKFRYSIYTISRSKNKSNKNHFCLSSYSTDEIENSYNWFKNFNKKLDVLLIMNGFGKGGKINEISLLDIEEMINSNLLIPYKYLYYFTKKLIEQKFGNIIFFGSVAGIKYSPNFAMYSATKFALRALVEAYRNEFQEYNIKTTNLQPGFVETKFWDKFALGNQPLDYNKQNAISVQDVSELINNAIFMNDNSNLTINELTFRSVFQER